MTQREAIEKALQKLGGRAQLHDIYPLAIEIGDFSGSQNKEATIRNCLLMSPKSFRRSPDKPKGWWELISFQKEIAKREQRIKELMKENERLKAMPKEDDFVVRFVEETKRFYKHERKKADAIRQIMIKLGRQDAEAEIDAWIDGKEYKPFVNVAGDYVVNKNVDNEVNNVATGATGINVNKDKR